MTSKATGQGIENIFKHSNTVWLNGAIQSCLEIRFPLCTDYKTGYKYIVFVSTCFFSLSGRGMRRAVTWLFLLRQTHETRKNLVTDTSSKNFLFYYFQELFSWTENNKNAGGWFLKMG
jgi:hypothetical protein